MARANAAGTFKVYWSDQTAGKIFSAGRDIPPGHTAATRTDDVAVLSGLPTTGFPLAGIAIDGPGGKVYWPIGFGGQIRRANLDGSGVEIVVAVPMSIAPTGVSLDLVNGKLYWMDLGLGAIRRAGIEIPMGQTAATRTDVETIVSANTIAAFAIDPAGKIYWADSIAKIIKRTDLNGPAVIEELVMEQLGVSVALDPAGGKMYWTHQSNDNTGDALRRANLDGSNVETLVFRLNSRLRGIGLDLDAGKVYCVEQETVGPVNKIIRANLDGTGQEVLVIQSPADSVSPIGLALLPCFADDCDQDGELDVSDNCPFAVNPDQEDFDEDLIGDACDNCFLDMNGGQEDGDGDNIGDVCDECPTDPLNDDEGDGWCYSVDNCPTEFNPSQSDGDNDGVGNDCDSCPSSTTLDRLFWSSNDLLGVIRRADLDNSACRFDVAFTRVTNGLEIDSDAGLVYWTNILPDEIKRASLTGGGVETILTGLNNPWGMALDTLNGKLYWVEDDGSNNLHRVRRSNIDGSGIETIVESDVGRPRDIAVDPIGGKVYWTDYDGMPSDSIKRADLNGMNVETLASGVFAGLNPSGIALDTPNGKVYWISNDGEGIRRMNMDGTGEIEDVVTEAGSNPSGGTGLVLDLDARVLYWTQISGGIRSADMDGVDANVTTYLTDPGTIVQGLALYRAPAITVGDCDGNGTLEFDDVPCFVDALLDIDTVPSGGIDRSDVNGDESTDGLDIQIFIDLLLP